MALRGTPTRRTTDRLEDAASWLLVAAGLFVLLLSYGIGAQAHVQFAERGRAESAERSPAVARLLSDTTAAGSLDPRSSTVVVPATWQDRSGSTRTGLIVAPRGIQTGRTVPIWTDTAGAAVPAPLSETGALLSGLIAGVVVFTIGVGLLYGLWALLRRATLAANCARRDAEWREVAPVWTRGNGTRG